MTRIGHIDNAKAIGIMLIVASHVVLETDKASTYDAFIYKEWCNLIASFYVPLFFVLSGMFESDSVSWSKTKKRLLKLTKYLVIFYVWGIFAYTIINRQVDILRGARLYTPNWFLIVLIYITLAFNIVKKNGIKVQIIWVLISGGIGYVLACRHHSFLFLGQSLLCLPFYALGFWCKNWFKRTECSVSVLIVSFVCWMIPTLLFKSPQNISINLVGRDLISFYLAAFSGSVFVIELCKIIHSNALCFIGRNSIVIMMVHFSFMYINYNILHICINSLLIWTIFVVLWITISVIMIPLFRNKYYDVFL